MGTVSLLVSGILVSIGFLFALAAIFERDMLRATVFSAVQAACYSVAFFMIMAPDIVLAYIAIAVGVYSALLVVVIRKTERYEED